jgi:hypothetical protein
MTPQASLALWWQPGRHMAAGWWRQLDLACWQTRYRALPALRPALDRVIAARLGHDGAPPPADPLADRLLADPCWRDALCIGLGLWALQCPDYLWLRPFRQALAPMLSPQQLTQLLALFPATHRRAPVLAPGLLPQAARQAGAAWLAHAEQPGLALCRLLWPPSAHTAPARSIRPVLTRLARWL